MMKIKQLLIPILLVLSSLGYAQTTSISYKALVKNGTEIYASQNLDVHFLIYNGNPASSGILVYQETHNSVLSDDNGIIILNIGDGETSDDWNAVLWNQSDVFISTEFDIGSGFVDMGTQSFQYVPYAKYAENANNVFSGEYSDLSGAPTTVSSFSNDANYLTSEVDGSVSNELQALSLIGDQLSISDGNSVTLPAGTAYTAGSGIDITGGVIINSGDTDASDDFSGEYSDLSGAPTTVSSFSNDANYLTSEVDGSVSNELQALSLSGDQLSISDGNSVTLPAGTAYTAGSGIDITAGVITNSGDTDASDDFSGLYMDLIGNPVTFFVEGTSEYPELITSDIYRLSGLALGSPYVDDAKLDISLNGTGTSNEETIGISITNTNTSSADLTGIALNINNDNNGVHYGSNTVITGNGDGDVIASYSELNSSGLGIQKAQWNVVDGIGNGHQYGMHNEISNSGSGIQYGIANDLSGNGSGNHFGTYNSLSGSGTGEQYASYNRIYNDNNENHLGQFSWLSGNGSGTHYGNYSLLSGTGIGKQYGNYIEISNSGNGAQYGNYTLMNSNGEGLQYANYTEITGTGNSNQYGYKFINDNEGSGVHYGGYFEMSGSGTGANIGAYYFLHGTGSGIQYGTRNLISNTGNSSHHGVNNVLSGSGSGNKYGSYNYIISSAGGTHYAVYGNATKAGSYAGYFNGDVNVSQDITVDGEVHNENSGSGKANVLAYIYGRVSDTGTMLPAGSTEGFTVTKNGTGSYRITFSTAMANTQAYMVVATLANDGSGAGCIMVDYSSTYCDIYTHADNGVWQDRSFSFVIFKH
ncbi:MAG: hypothetical protein U9N51_09455 [Bacteroidota bacterium]|nr:hypothetical protein [Bacteroidota bacterium]